MQKTKNGLVLRKDDYEILQGCLRNGIYRNTFDRSNAEELQAELKRATLVSKEDFPEDVVRLNSKVRVKEEKRNNVMELVLVTPDKADIRQRKISVMAPVGAALIGFRQGQKVVWQVPSGKKTFVIMEVINE
ncbi:MAG: nucleoside diphosphate kinase regulator [Chitinophagaceae bacterium]|nr:MAG: nucleoside diphosphate kinase regulator [Chitinophagaceae bacterium]